MLAHSVRRDALRRRARRVLLAALALGAPSTAGAQRAAGPGLPPATARPTPGSVRLRLTGIGTNVTVNRTTGVRFTLTSADGVTFASAGTFDNVNLYGRWAGLTGQATACHVPAPDALCLRLSGELELGNDGSRFPPGTRTPFTLTLAITGSAGVGVYQIARLAGFPADQVGTLTLAVAGGATP